ncbi:ribonuclease III [Rickettsiella endosymbiont of Litargus connexus]|uniref:ribonuclease III n=1 Tax=Rickettsiella endosymbiont of Litargus connexus TaxID=3066237 RepID=UPI0027F7C00C|nr:ribonuclease III [Gammaproteobacteria bacterium]MDQ5899274.1 ribonuclease [Pseudomonadota bacterium]
MKAEIEILCEKLNYRFKNHELLEDALSHRSFRGNKNNERLEYLGDAVLNFVIAAALFRQNIKAREGELSRLRANLVRGETLTDLAQEFELGKYLRLGAGELKTGGAQRKSILADGMEAVVGAIYLDGGFQVCETCILRWYANRLENVETIPELKDPKTRLQEYLQAKKLALPVYTILALEGPAHQQSFKVECHLHGLPNKAIGIGSSRRRAEQKAAEKILEELELIYKA